MLLNPLFYTILVSRLKKEEFIKIESKQTEATSSVEIIFKL